MQTKIWAIALVLIGGLIASFGPIFLKKGAKDFNLNIIQQLKNRNIMLGLFFYSISVLLFVPALRGGELSVLYPLVSVSYIWICLFSIKLLGEKMNWMKWLGIGFIILGVGFIGVS